MKSRLDMGANMLADAFWKFLVYNTKLSSKQDLNPRCDTPLVRVILLLDAFLPLGINQVINERDILGTQLIRRNDELALLYEKLKIQQSTLKKVRYGPRARSPNQQFLVEDLSKHRQCVFLRLLHTRWSTAGVLPYSDMNDFDKFNIIVVPWSPCCRNTSFATFRLSPSSVICLFRSPSYAPLPLSGTHNADFYTFSHPRRARPATACA